MEVFLVRHGQTGGNVARRHQAEDTPLTELGREQVAYTAKALKELEPTHLLSSTHVRALESSEIIARETGLFPETDPVFIEVVRPKYIYGFHHHTMRSLWYVLRWFFGLVGGETTDAKGESYRSLRTRVEAAQAVLEQYPAEARVVVVSHSIFINFFLIHMCNPRRMSFIRAVLSWRLIRGMKNASITKVRYTADAHGCRWERVRDVPRSELT